MNPTDTPPVLVIGEPGGVRDLLAAIDRGMAAPTPALHDTRAGYPPEWADLAPKPNRAQRRAMRRAGR